MEPGGADVRGVSEERPNPIRVALVDDHPMIRDVLRAACQERPNLVVVGEASSGSEALVMCRNAAPDVLVLDLSLPGLDGLEVARRLRTLGDGPRILVLSARDDREAVLESIRAGASAFLDKTAPVERIIGAIESIASGAQVLSLEQQRRAHAALGDLARAARAAAAGSSFLTRREREVLDLLVGGLTSRQMAQRLAVSERTVEAHIASVYRKLDVRTRVQAVHRAASLGLADLG